MKTLSTLIAGVAAITISTTSMSAQSLAVARPALTCRNSVGERIGCGDIRRDTRDLRVDRREIRGDKREIRVDRREGDRLEVRRDRRDLLGDNHDLRLDRRDRRRDVRRLNRI
jgi:hypothetical protein